MKSGYGIYEWDWNGAKYEGEWENDKMNGYGTFYYSSYSNGYKLECTFVDNEPDGECEYWIDETTSYSTNWYKGFALSVNN